MKKKDQILSSQSAYVSADLIRMSASQDIFFDSGLENLFYGQRVDLLSQKGEFSLIKASESVGWVPSRFITRDKASVYPVFINDEVYGYDHDEVKKVRRLLRDETFGGVLQLALRPTEFILWRLKERRTKVTWPTQRPRLPGLWDTLLTGVRGVSSGRFPRTESVLEGCDQAGQSWLGWVESVTPNGVIVVETVGRSVVGQYQKISLDRKSWQAESAVFISFS